MKSKQRKKSAEKKSKKRKSVKSYKRKPKKSLKAKKPLVLWFEINWINVCKKRSRKKKKSIKRNKTKVKHDGNKQINNSFSEKEMIDYLVS